MLNVQAEKLASKNPHLQGDQHRSFAALRKMEAIPTGSGVVKRVFFSALPVALKPVEAEGAHI